MDKKNDEEVEVLDLWETKSDEIMSAKDRKIKPSRNTVKHWVIVFVTIGAFLVMWYAMFAQPLAYNNRQMNASWNISFTNMNVSSIVGNAKETKKPDYTSTKGSFFISLTGAGDKIVYDVEITNSGTLDAEVESIYVVPANQPNEQIIYSVSDISVGDELKAGASTTMKVTAMYNNNSTNKGPIRKDMSVIVNYKQR